MKKEQLNPCPHCGKPLEKVTQSSNSMLNAEQFDAARLGDYFCDACPETGERYRYFWDRDLTRSTPPATAMRDDDLWHIAGVVTSLNGGNLLNVSQRECVTAMRAAFMDPDAGRAFIAAQTTEPVAWEEAQRVCDLPNVDEALRGFAEDQTGDNATCLVRAILAAQRQDSEQSRLMLADDTSPRIPQRPDSDKDAELRRVANELRAYSPEGDEYNGKYIHKVWAREIDAAIAKGTEP